MLLRPSTPLSALLFAAFALLLLACLSTPVVKGIPLGSFEDITFGVFGFCRNEGCSSIGIGYDEEIFRDKPQSFDMPAGVRSTISAILIVHPVAALLTLVLFIMAVASHFHAASHSSRYLLVMFIFTILDFVICLLSFVIDVLVFIPHMAWGSYIVLAATIMVAMSGVVSCAMRRAVMGRKARRKKIAENAEMSGENYYNREGGFKTFDATSQPAIPLTSGANGGNHDNLPAFASFEQTKREGQISDERIPLKHTRTPSNAGSLPSNRGTNDMPHGADVALMNVPPPPSSQRSASRDRYGNPVNGPPDGYGVARGPSMDSMRSRGSQNFRGGRGGPYGRGGHDMYGGPSRGRGGYGGPPGRGGYGPPRGRGGLGPPPRGHQAMRGGLPPPHGYANMGPQYERRPSADPHGAGPYGRRPSDSYSNGPSAKPSVNGGYEPYNPNNAGMDLPRAESPPPMPVVAMSNELAPSRGSPVEMDATPTNQVYGDYPNIRDSDTDVAGMVGLQQGRSPGPHEAYAGDANKYTQEQPYMPPRAAWGQDGRNSPRSASPSNTHLRAPAELPGRHSPAVVPRRGDPGHYYEDVDPRFAEPSPSNPHPPTAEPVYEDVHVTVGGARSPAESERSNFTSISQRGVNPRWNPPPPMPQYHGTPPQRGPAPGQQRQDVLLDNPDFQLGGGARGPNRRGGPGMIPGSAYPTGF